MGASGEHIGSRRSHQGELETQEMGSRRIHQGELDKSELEAPDQGSWAGSSDWASKVLARQDQEEI